MKHIKDIKNKIEWEKYYNPNFNWHSVQLYSKNILSEDFIREFKDKVDWWYISKYQTLSEDFILEFREKIHWELLLNENKKCNLSKSFKETWKWLATLCHNIYNDALSNI